MQKMRRGDKEITEQKEIDRIIRDARVCRLAMADGDQPYVLPLNFGYDYPFLYFHSALEGRKLTVLKENPKVCFLFDRLEKLNKDKSACEWGADFVSVIGEGRAAFLEDNGDKRTALASIMAQYSDREFEFSDENLDRTAVIRVEISKITGKKSG